MATTTPAQLVTVQLGATVASQYTVPANRVLVITRIALLNTTGADRTVDLHLVASGDSADGTNQILDAKVMEATMKSPYLVAGAERQVLAAGGQIFAGADAATAVTMVASGILLTVA